MLGYSAIHAGLSYLPLALTIIFSAALGSQLVTKLGYKPVLATGEEGLANTKFISALIEAAQLGQPVQLTVCSGGGADAE